MTPPDERSDRRSDLLLTAYNTHKTEASMLLAGFEPTIPAIEQPQTQALERAATEIGKAVFVFQMSVVLRDYWYYVSVILI
jgi:hypothetical protein